MKIDAIVAGLGATGSAVAAELARRGLAVLGLDAHHPPHTLGSHHGESRIIRKAYYEHPAYVPLLERAFPAWEALEHATGERLMLRTGGLMIGTPEGELVRGVLESARTHGLAHERLTSRQLMRRHPAFKVTPDIEAVWEADPGILFPEACVRTLLGVASAHGATLRYDTPVRAWHASGGRTRVEVDGARFEAPVLVLAAGAGLARLAAGFGPPLSIERQVVAHLVPSANAASFAPERFPIFCFEEPDGDFYYGFPDLGQGVKAGRHHRGAIVSSDSIDRTVAPADLAPVRGFLERHLPDANGALIASAVCLYTNTPNAHFVVDRLPQAPNVILASACSGHGFKFAPILGEIVADLVQDKAPRYDTALFRLA